MKNKFRIRFPLFMLFIILTLQYTAGCSSTEITSGDILVDKKLPKPNTIWIYPFLPAPESMYLNSNIIDTNKFDLTHIRQDNYNLAIILGNVIAHDVIEKVNKMGLNSKLAVDSSHFKDNDIVLRGYLYSINKGNAAKRIFIGLGYGASFLDTYIIGYHVTHLGLKELSSANVLASGGKMPGGGIVSIPMFILLRNPVALIVGPAVKGVQEIIGGPTIKGRANDTADKIVAVLKEKFIKEGWIKK